MSRSKRLFHFNLLTISRADATYKRSLRSIKMHFWLAIYLLTPENKMKNNITIIYDCKYSQGDYSSAEVQGDISVFRLGGSITFNINPKTASRSSCSYFYTLNLAGICTRKPATYPQDTLQADGYTENGGKMSWPKRPKLLVTRPSEWTGSQFSRFKTSVTMLGP